MKPEIEIKNLKKQVKELRELALAAGIPPLVVYLPELALKQIPKGKKLNKPVVIKLLPVLEVFRWLLGYTDFPERQKGDGLYWWRKELRQKLKALNIDVK
jgi:hypothetical protein